MHTCIICNHSKIANFFKKILSDLLLICKTAERQKEDLTLQQSCSFLCLHYSSVDKKEWRVGNQTDLLLSSWKDRKLKEHFYLELIICWRKQKSADWAILRFLSSCRRLPKGFFLKKTQSHHFSVCVNTKLCKKKAPTKNRIYIFLYYVKSSIFVQKVEFWYL